MNVRKVLTLFIMLLMLSSVSAESAIRIITPEEEQDINFIETNTQSKKRVVKKKKDSRRVRRWKKILARKRKAARKKILEDRF